MDSAKVSTADCSFSVRPLLASKVVSPCCLALYQKAVTVNQCISKFTNGELVVLLTRTPPKFMPPTVMRNSRQSIQELHIVPSKRMSSSAAIFTRPCVQQSMMKKWTFFSGSLMKTVPASAFDLRATHLLPQVIFSFFAFRARKA